MAPPTLTAGEVGELWVVRTAVIDPFCRGCGGTPIPEFGKLLAAPREPGCNMTEFRACGVPLGLNPCPGVICPEIPSAIAAFAGGCSIVKQFWPTELDFGF